MRNFVNVEICHCCVGFIAYVTLKWSQDIHITGYGMLSNQMLLKTVGANEVFVANGAVHSDCRRCFVFRFCFYQW